MSFCTPSESKIEDAVTRSLRSCTIHGHDSVWLVSITSATLPKWHYNCNIQICTYFFQRFEKSPWSAAQSQDLRVCFKMPHASFPRESWPIWRQRSHIITVSNLRHVEVSIRPSFHVCLTKSPMIFKTSECSFLTSPIPWFARRSVSCPVLFQVSWWAPNQTYVWMQCNQYHVLTVLVLDIANLLLGYTWSLLSHSRIIDQFIVVLINRILEISDDSWYLFKRDEMSRAAHKMSWAPHKMSWAAHTLISIPHVKFVHLVWTISQPDRATRPRQLYSSQSNRY